MGPKEVMSALVGVQPTPRLPSARRGTPLPRSCPARSLATIITTSVSAT